MFLLIANVIYFFHWVLFISLLVCIVGIFMGIHSRIVSKLESDNNYLSRKDKKFLKAHGCSSFKEYYAKEAEKEKNSVSSYLEKHLELYKLFLDDPVKALASDPELKRRWDLSSHHTDFIEQDHIVALYEEEKREELERKNKVYENPLEKYWEEERDPLLDVEIDAKDFISQILDDEKFAELFIKYGKDYNYYQEVISDPEVIKKYGKFIKVPKASKANKTKNSSLKSAKDDNQKEKKTKTTEKRPRAVFED